MSQAAPVFLANVSAVEICRRFELKKEAWPLLRHDMGAKQFVEVLLANMQYVTAIDFVANALPIRDAIWWGCLCLHHACGSSLLPIEQASCQMIVLWLLRPNDQERVALAKAHADSLGAASPTGRLAMAAHIAGLTITGLSSPPSSVGSAAKAVADSVKLSSTKVEPLKLQPMQRQFIELGTHMGPAWLPQTA